MTTTGILDQHNEPVPGHGAVNIQPVNTVSQVITPTMPVLRSVEVDLVTGNHGRGGDRLTLTVLDGATERVKVAADVAEGFQGYCRFELPDGGLRVDVGHPLSLRLSDTGKIVFWWRYTGGNRYPAGQAWFHGAAWSDNDFFFRTYGDADPDLAVLQTAAAVTQRTAPAYRSPTPAELTTGKIGLGQLRAGKVGAAAGTLQPLGFGVRSGKDPLTGRSYALAVSELGTAREWGLYLVDLSVTPSVCIAVPHTRYDEVCESLALYLWRAIPGAFLMMATVHRNTTWQGGGANAVADPAQNTESLFHHAWVDDAPGARIPQVQIHGFRDRTEVPSLKDVRVVASVGSADLTAPAKRIAAALTAAGIITAVGWGNPSQDLKDAKLLATTNEQSRAAHGTGRVWVHLEIAGSLRHASPPTAWYGVMDAVASAHPEQP